MFGRGLAAGKYVSLRLRKRAETGKRQIAEADAKVSARGGDDRRTDLAQLHGGGS